MSILSVNNYYIFDGDTISIPVNGEKISVRARWVDCPETQKKNISETPENLNQWKWGDLAKSYLLSLLKNGNPQLLVELCETDMYGRRLGNWYLNEPRLENNIQLKLVEAGYAADLLPIQKYNLSESECELFVAIVSAQNCAWREKRGMWADPNFQIPFEWRKALKKNS